MKPYRSLCDLPHWPASTELFHGTTAASTAGDVVRLAGALARDIADRRQESEIDRIAVTCEDPSAFLATLLACFAARATAIIPGVTSAEALADRDKLFDYLVTDEVVTSSLSKDTLAPDNAALVIPEAEACYLTFFTSGSTAEPQPVPKTWRQIEAEAETLHQQFGADLSGAQIISTVPHHHIYGILFCLVWPLGAGLLLVAPRQGSIDTALDLAEEIPSAVVSCPAHIMRVGVRQAASRPPVKVFSSGAPLPATGAMAIAEVTGAHPVEVYGSTETGGIAFRTQATPEAEWQVFPGVEVKQAISGCLTVRSPVTPNADWFDTSDLCELSPDGRRFRLGGRNDRVIKVEGVRVSLPRIEALAQANAFVLEAAALGLDTDKGHRLAMVATLTPEGENLLQSKGKFRLERDLSTAIKNAENAASAPKLWRFVREIPTNERGKRQVAALTALFSR